MISKNLSALKPQKDFAKHAQPQPKKGRTYKMKQGSIHGYRSRLQVGRGSNKQGRIHGYPCHWGIWAGAVSLTSHPRIAHGQRYPVPCLE